MQKVHLAPLWAIVAGMVGLTAMASFGTLTAAGWMAGPLYLAVSNLLLSRGLRRRGISVFGPANTATTVRSTLVGLIAALVATSFSEAISVELLIGLTVPALALDAVDGWLARRTGTISELGARYDMEVDAFLILVLSVYVAPDLGWWVLAIGLMRYAYVAAGWFLPWLHGAAPARYWNKVVAALAGIGLALAASDLAPRRLDIVVVAICLALLVESFGRDVIWLYRRRQPQAHSAGSLGELSTEGVADVGSGV